MTTRLDSQTHNLFAGKTNPGSDAELWQRLKAGDQNALSLIYTTYFDKLYNFGSRLVQDSGQLEDLIQDLFIELWNHRQTLGDVTFIKLYLFTCFRRKIFREKSKMSIHSSLPSFQLELSHKSHYLNQQIDKEIQQKLIKLINRLTNQQKEAIYLVYYDELSYKEVACVMELKVRTVYNLVHEGLLRLREHKNHIYFFFIYLYAAGIHSVLRVFLSRDVLICC